ncbi:hypothetical protein D3C71_1283170 [compost metagenome]
MITFEGTAGLPGSDGVAIAVLLMFPDAAFAGTSPVMLTVTVPFPAGRSALSATVFPVPLAPDLITAPEVAVAVQFTLVNVAGTASLISTFIALPGPALLSSNV